MSVPCPNAGKATPSATAAAVENTASPALMALGIAKAGSGVNPARPISVVAIDLFAPLVHLLGLQAQRGDGACVEPGDADGLAGFLAIAIRAVLDAFQGGIDLGDQLALAVAGAQLQRAVAFRGCAV